MTTLPIYKTCPKCGRRYVWNPSAGRTSCPDCNSPVMKSGKVIGTILKGITGNGKR